MNAFAQSSTFIETDLLKSFRKIGYWDEKRATDTSYNPAFEDSLDNANNLFGKKLKYYTSQFPSTINNSFISLKKENLNICTSNDNCFRIYSWDVQGGGTMHEFENVFQYKLENGVQSVLDTPKNDGDFGPNYHKLYTLKVGSNTYYMAVYLFIESSRYYGEGIQCFSISQGKLSDNERIIKTSTGLHSQIYYEADYGSVADWKVRPSIYYDAHNQTIHIPLVESKGKVTHRYITYKFTGQYFEKVKS